MLIAHQPAEARAQIQAWRLAGETVAVVPTMGNLHAGHLALVAEGRRRARRVVVSVFVNPAQFGPNEDFDRYPRTLEADCAALQRADCDLLFAPAVDAMYPAGWVDMATVTAPRALTEILCGAFRPGHFDGVATVVVKLFHAMPGDLAIFGEKDFQQLMVVRRLVADLLMPIEIVGLPTVRDSDGLALSSRNQYLDPIERERAGLIHRTLREMIARWHAGAELQQVESAARDALEFAGFRVDYTSLRRASDLGPVVRSDREVVALVAAWLGKTRLIDNLRS